MDESTLPECPVCGTKTQVWVNQRTGEMTCHRATCGNVSLAGIPASRERWEVAPAGPGDYEFWCGETGYEPQSRVWRAGRWPHDELVCDIDAGFADPPVALIRSGLITPRWRKKTEAP